jgi:hypothetical protein
MEAYSRRRNIDFHAFCILLLDDDQWSVNALVILKRLKGPEKRGMRNSKHLNLYNIYVSIAYLQYF